MTHTKKRVAINGFGRIGRAAFKIALEQGTVEIVAINDLTDASILAHLLQYDTAYGHYRRDVSAKEHN
jgi:glyceraldehyde 3-phosphate dehydrogenase